MLLCRLLLAGVAGPRGRARRFMLIALLLRRPQASPRSCATRHRRQVGVGSGHLVTPPIGCQLCD
eukprot:4901074-Amphidinium_carterae.1